MSFSINGTNGVTYPDASTQATAGFTGFRNRIINGGMVIDQRNAGAAVTGSNYTLDRWQVGYDSGPTVTTQRSTTAPSGFTNSLSLTITASASPSGQATFRQYIEGYNTADLGWGNASAQTVILSFWVRSSVIGTYAVAFQNSAYNRSYVATYTVNSANTWEQKSITVSGDVTGTWATDNTQGIRIFFDIGCTTTYNTTAGAWAAGQYFRTSACVNLIANAGATFYITGVQLEKGSTATPFEFRPYGTELALCQRYYKRYQGNHAYSPICNGFAGNTTQAYVHPVINTPMRTTPTVGYSNLQLSNPAVGSFTVSSISISDAVTNTDCGVVQLYVASSSMTGGAGLVLRNANNTAGYLELTSEL